MKDSLTLLQRVSTEQVSKLTTILINRNQVATAKIERSKAQFDQFKQELDTVWSRLYIDKEGDDDSLEYAWLLYFYFILLAPTNENTSEIAFGNLLLILLNQTLMI